MSTTARNNHFVPQFYLRRWAERGRAQVMAYRKAEGAETEGGENGRPARSYVPDE